MIPIPVFWTKYTTTMQGRVLKVVPCENCSTEYVYLLERESTGTGTSMYMLNNEGAEGHAKSAAEDTLQSALENDYDPVPCPACGHYQRYMIPKLVESKGMWIQAVMLLVIVIGCIAAVMALYCSVRYLQHPNDHLFGRMVTAWSLLVLLFLVGLSLSVVNKVRIRRFDPNGEDQQARIAIGRSRAVTRKEFEQMEKRTS